MKKIGKIIGIVLAVLGIIGLIIPFSLCKLEKTQTFDFNSSGVYIQNKTIFPHTFHGDYILIWVCEGKIEKNPRSIDGDRDPCRYYSMREGVEYKDFLNNTIIELNRGELKFIQKGFFCIWNEK